MTEDSRKGVPPVRFSGQCLRTLCPKSSQGMNIRGETFATLLRAAMLTPAWDVAGVAGAPGPSRGDARCRRSCCTKVRVGTSPPGATLSHKVNSEFRPAVPPSTVPVSGLQRRRMSPQCRSFHPLWHPGPRFWGGSGVKRGGAGKKYQDFSKLEADFSSLLPRDGLTDPNQVQWPSCRPAPGVPPAVTVCGPSCPLCSQSLLLWPTAPFGCKL